ncbi:MAG TPA: hypothetical protein VGC79_29485 [Polyangiaceae bacterium]
MGSARIEPSVTARYNNLAREIVAVGASTFEERSRKTFWRKHPIPFSEGETSGLPGGFVIAEQIWGQLGHQSDDVQTLRIIQDVGLERFVNVMK